jgi:hypothetical protein
MIFGYYNDTIFTVIYNDAIYIYIHSLVHTTTIPGILIMMIFVIPVSLYNAIQFG